MNELLRHSRSLEEKNLRRKIIYFPEQSRNEAKRSEIIPQFEKVDAFLKC
jgi:hypothetical protein